MDECLNSVRAFRRAQGFLDEVRRHWEAYFALRPFKTRIETGPDGERRVIAYTDPSPPAEIGDAIADYARNAVSALDYRITELAKADPAVPSRRAFPMVDTAEKFTRALKAGLLEGVPARDRELIEARQPFNATEPFKHPLQKLAALRHMAAHRGIPTAASIHYHAQTQINVSQLGSNVFSGNKAGDVNFGAGVRADFGNGVTIEAIGPTRIPPQGLCVMKLNGPVQLSSLAQSGNAGIVFDAGAPELNGLAIQPTLAALHLVVEQILIETEPQVVG